MTFTLPNLPAKHEGAEAIADQVELSCLDDGETSIQSIANMLARDSDSSEDSYSGCDDLEDELHNLVGEAFDVIGTRNSNCGSSYPFKLSDDGHTLAFDVSRPPIKDHLVYLFLLLSTRLNMNRNRNRYFHGIDGTLLLEHLSAHILRKYLGEPAEAMVIGTGRDSSFEDVVNSFCKRVGEGVRYVDHDNMGSTVKDDGLDAVAWSPFNDERPSQLILFAQCKTGTNWREETKKLRPEVFCARWFSATPLVIPVAAFCVSESIGKNEWKAITRGAGVFFDRSRIVQWALDVPVEILKDLKLWTISAVDCVRRV